VTVKKIFMAISSSELAMQILEKTSIGRISRGQVEVLGLLLERKNQWVPHNEIASYLAQQDIFSPNLKPDTIRQETLRILRVLAKKVEEYSRDAEKLPELEALKIERRRGRGARLVTSPQDELAYPMQADVTGDLFKEEVLSRLTRLEFLAARLTEKLEDVLQILNELRSLSPAGTKGHDTPS